MNKIYKTVKSENIFYICLALLFIFLVLRNVGLLPSVFGDEYTYSKLSRLVHSSDSTIPGYIYLKIYNITNYFGNHFHEAAKIINVILFISAAPFIFITCRRVASKGHAVLVALLAVLGPINSYTAYYMPESFYFLSFWLLCWYLLDLNTESNIWRWFVAGSFYAISALIKPHSIFFLPAIIVYIAFLYFSINRLFCLRAFKSFMFFFIGAVFVKFGVSYILAGPSGLTLFGPLYSTIASSTTGDAEKYTLLLIATAQSLKGHLLVLGLLCGLPIAIALIVSIKALSSRNYNFDHRRSILAVNEKIAFFSILLILNLICTVAIFTASVAQPGTSESPYRLHLRYYNFALPLFYILSACAIANPICTKKNTRLLFGCVFFIACTYAFFTNLIPFIPSHVDNPEIFGILKNINVFKIICVLFAMTLAIWVYSSKKGIQLYLYVVLPIYTFVSSYYVGSEIKKRRIEDIYDKAGIFTKQYLPADDLSKVVAVGSNPACLLRTLFYIDNTKSSVSVIQKNNPYDISKLDHDKEWVILFDDIELIGNFSYSLPMNGFTLIRSKRENTIFFNKGLWPGIISKTKGLSRPEPWGTWSQSNTVMFEFVAPLPAEFNLHLSASAFGPNKDSEFEVMVGSHSNKFRLSSFREEKIISMKNPDGVRELRIKIPNAISPKELGVSGDDRKLGIGFFDMKIVESPTVLEHSPQKLDSQ